MQIDEKTNTQLTYQGKWLQKKNEIKLKIREIPLQYLSAALPD